MPEISPRWHRCRWPGCPRSVRPSRWACVDHWFKLPRALRTAILNNYMPGHAPGAGYIEADRKARQWASTHDKASSPAPVAPAAPDGPPRAARDPTAALWENDSAD